MDRLPVHELSALNDDSLVYDLCTGRQLGCHAVAITAPISVASGTRTDEQMKAHGHQDRAYENNVHPTRHRVGCLDKSPFP